MIAARVLVVEDSVLNAGLLGDMLMAMGHAVCATEASEAGAIAAAARCRPDLVIVDIQLGRGSGIRAIAEIMRNGFVPHVFVSGDLSELSGPRAGVAMLRKPFRMAQLDQAIQHVLLPQRHALPILPG
ncbi:MAG: response regulator [Rhodospirillales bacterium]|nr:response regulator [Rhodospirillales bacterium]